MGLERRSGIGMTDNEAVPGYRDRPMVARVAYRVQEAAQPSGSI